ncbi:MAG: hypothetical protein OEY08_08950 [Gammaproteobacteria bacterium]|nr:hypothetical protein [Gammaproteobacteria bacterium]
MNPRNLINSRILALLCVIFLVLVLAACGGGGGEPRIEPPPVRDDCGSDSVLENGVCRQFALRSDERIPTRFVEDGMPVSLEAVVFRPLTGERFPTIVVNHGSTGSGSDPDLFRLTFTHKPISLFFVERGWQVIFPQRRGRGLSDGLYDEGFTPDRSGYSCELDAALAGADRALADLDVITDWVRGRADVDTTRMLVSGTSRGGILSIALVARRPDVYLGAVNFVGGWIAEGCGDHLQINRALFRRGAAFPLQTLWLYASNDSFYSLPYTRGLFDDYAIAGGFGAFEEFTRAPGLNGHFIINDPDRWGPALDGYLGQLP